MKNLEEIIIKAFDDRDNINKDTQGEIRDAVDVTLNLLSKSQDISSFIGTPFFV